MRMMVQFVFPPEPFNAAVRDGSIGAKMRRILERQRPEAVYFTDCRGCRSAVLIINLPNASGIPAIAEPWLLTFNAQVEMHPVMTVEDLQAGDLEELGKEWGVEIPRE